MILTLIEKHHQCIEPDRTLELCNKQGNKYNTKIDIFNVSEYCFSKSLKIVGNGKQYISIP